MWGFQGIMTHLKPQNFTITIFHRTSIRNHDLEVFHNMDVVVGFFGYTLMNEVMGAISINEDNNFVMFEVYNQFQCLGRRDNNQGMHGYL
jgi:hypothetical protein